MDIKGIAGHIDEVAIELGNIVKSGEIQATIKNINEASISIKKTSENVNLRTTQLSQNIEKTRVEIDKLLAELNARTPEVAKSLNKSLQDLSYSLEQVNKATASIEGTVSEDSPLVNQLNSTLLEINRSAQAFRNLTETLEQQPESVLRGKTSPGKDK